VTDPGAVTGSVLPIAPGQGATDMVRGSAPSPQDYARLGELAGQMLTDPHDPTGDFQASGMMYNLGQLAAFHRGGPLDAQVRYGGSTPYANYGYGVYNAARGADLGDVLDLANLYGKLFSKYKFSKENPADQTYGSIPASNVQNITRGYHDYKNRTLAPQP
jgi:hypothetical protein